MLLDHIHSHIVQVLSLLLWTGALDLILVVIATAAVTTAGIIVIVIVVLVIIISLVKLKDMHCRQWFKTNVIGSFVSLNFCCFAVFLHVSYFVVVVASLWLIVLSKWWFCLNVRTTHDDNGDWCEWKKVFMLKYSMLMYKTGSECVCRKCYTLFWQMQMHIRNVQNLNFCSLYQSLRTLFSALLNFIISNLVVLFLL